MNEVEIKRLVNQLFPDKSPILVSACLLGVNCTFKASNNRNELVLNLLKYRQLIPICPEILGGFPTPRSPQCISKGTGSDVLESKSKVVNRKGEDVTNLFIKGAQETLKIAELFETKYAILKEKSPSCGVNSIFNVNHNSERLIQGKGVTTALLSINNIKIYSERDLKKQTID